MVTGKELELFVQESNAIEGIRAKPGEPLFDKHLEAARWVAKGMFQFFERPQVIHALLLGGIEPHAGTYRNCGVRVGRERMPHPLQIRRLMGEWQETFNKSILLAAQETDPGEKKRIAWRLHDHFLCIHPFQDGNGRTARLLLNMFRIAQGLSWHTVYAHETAQYYFRIEEYESTIFKPAHPDVYAG